LSRQPAGEARPARRQREPSASNASSSVGPQIFARPNPFPEPNYFLHRQSRRLGRQKLPAEKLTSARCDSFGGIMLLEFSGQPARHAAARGNTRRRVCGFACLAGLLLVGCWLSESGVALAAPDSIAQNGSNSRQTREEAARAIPFDKLPADVVGPVRQIVQNPSLFRRVPVQVIDCDPNLYLFLVRHPEVVVNIWQVMGISKVTLDRTGPNAYEGDDAAGTTGTVRLCYSNHDTQVLYADGVYEGPMFSQPIQAQCVLVLRAGYVQETNGRYYITNRLDAFIHIDHVGLDLIAKTFSPLVTKTIDINFRETAAFVGVVSRTAAANPQGMRRLADRLTLLEPEVRGEFSRLSTEVAVKAQLREAANGENETLLSTPRPLGKKLRR
jgi:hypothetical protein